MPPPFDINSLSPASSDLISAFPANEQSNRSVIEEWLTFISDPTTGLIRESALPDDAFDIPTGTKMLFVQTAAPTGWTKDITHNNKALRIVNGTAGTGGSIDFTTAFGSQNVGDTTLNTTQIPSHTHPVAATTGTESADHSHSGSTSTESAAHNHNYTQPTSFKIVQGDTGGPNNQVWNGTTTVQTGTENQAHAHTFTTGGRSAAHTHSFSTTSSATGGGLAHTHTLNLSVQYVDVIIATRN